MENEFSVTILTVENYDSGSFVLRLANSVNIYYFCLYVGHFTFQQLHISQNFNDCGIMNPM